VHPRYIWEQVFPILGDDYEENYGRSIAYKLLFQRQHALVAAVFVIGKYLMSDIKKPAPLSLKKRGWLLSFLVAGGVVFVV